METVNRTELRRTIEAALAQSAPTSLFGGTYTDATKKDWLNMEGVFEKKDQFDELTLRIQFALQQNAHGLNTSGEQSFQDGINHYLHYGALNEPLRVESVARGGDLVELCVMEHVLSAIQSEEFAVECQKKLDAMGGSPLYTNCPSFNLSAGTTSSSVSFTPPPIDPSMLSNISPQDLTASSSSVSFTEENDNRRQLGYDHAGNSGGVFSQTNPPPGKTFDGYGKGCTHINWKESDLA